jgi:hypothetical protein
MKITLILLSQNIIPALFLIKKLPCTKRQLSAARNKQLGWIVGGLFEGKPVSYHVQYILINLSKNEDIKFNAHCTFLD